MRRSETIPMWSPSTTMSPPLPGGEVIGVGGEGLSVAREINLEIGSAAEVNVRVRGGDLVGVRCLLDVGGNQ